MKTVLFTILPLGCILVAFVYTTILGVRSIKATGSVCLLTIPVSLLGLLLGRFLEASLRRPAALDDWINYQFGTKLERYEMVGTVEATFLLVLLAATAVIWAILIREEKCGQPAAQSKRHYGLVAAAFLCAAGIIVRGKLAALLILVLVWAKIL